MTTVQRVFNFSAGPAVMPVSVLEEIQHDLLALPGVGMSILEISHRSTIFESILARAEADIRTLAGVPAKLQGALPAGRRQHAVLDGADEPAGAGRHGRLHRQRLLGREGVQGSKKIGNARLAASTKAENYVRLPLQQELQLTDGAAYVHMTSNNTIEGTEYRTLPEAGDAPLVSDTSSDMFSHPIDIARHALIYAGAQKNMGPAGLTHRDHSR